MIFVGQMTFCQQKKWPVKPETYNSTAFQIKKGGYTSLYGSNKNSAAEGLSVSKPRAKPYIFVKYLPEAKKIASVKTNNASLSFSVIPVNFYTQNFGFFCKKELQMERFTKLPFKFRLGNVQQCDWMEGKLNAVIR